MDLSDIPFLNDAADWFWTDRSDWLPYVEYFGMAWGAWSVLDGAVSVVQSHRYIIRDLKNTSRKIQTLEGVLQFGTGSLMLVNRCLENPFPVYSLFLINSVCEALTALMSYVSLWWHDYNDFECYLPSYHAQLPGGKGQETYLQSLEKAKIKFLEKSMVAAGWLAVNTLHPAVLFYIVIGMSYLHPVYQWAKPGLSKVAGTLFSMCRSNPKEAAESEQYVFKEDDEVIPGPDFPGGEHSDFPDGHPESMRGCCRCM